MSDFTPAENAEFIRLLKKIQENRYWVPTLEAWQEVQRTFSRWAVELVIVEQKANTPAILLSRYEGDAVPSHKGFFHIPGGFERLPESISQTCSRIAKDEIGVDVHYKGLLDIHKWDEEESPMGAHLLSVYVRCEPISPIETSDRMRFFTHGELLALGPEEMVSNHPHRAFANSYLQRLEQ
jgi:ADP-ribose pyrophosphatase YjhB (NUDIX family)